MHKKRQTWIFESFNFKLKKKIKDNLTLCYKKKLNVSQRYKFLYAPFLFKDPKKVVTEVYCPLCPLCLLSLEVPSANQRLSQITEQCLHTQEIVCLIHQNTSHLDIRIIWSDDWILSNYFLFTIKILPKKQQVSPFVGVQIDVTGCTT